MSDDPNPVPETGIEVFATRRAPRRRSDRQIVREYLTEIVGKLNEGWRYEENRQSWNGPRIQRQAQHAL